MMDCFETIEKTGGGIIGFVSSMALRDINSLLSACVALLTIVYLGVSIVKKIRDMRGEK